MRDSLYYSDADPIKSYELTLYIHRKRKSVKKADVKLLSKILKRIKQWKMN